MTTDIDIAIIQLRECAQSIGTYLPASSAATIAAAWDTITAERDTLANANAANVGLLRKAEAERDEFAEALREKSTELAETQALELNHQGACVRLKAERDAYKAEADEAQRANDGLAEAVARLARERDAALAQLAEAKAEIERLRKLGYKLEVGNGR